VAAVQRAGGQVVYDWHYKDRRFTRGSRSV
jgi:hypothetical protein